MKTNRNKIINWLNFIYIQQKFSFKPIKIALIKVNWPGRRKNAEKKQEELFVKREGDEWKESSKMTNCVRLPCYFHSFVKSNLFLHCVFSVSFSPSPVDFDTLHRNRTEYSVFPFLSLFFCEIGEMLKRICLILCAMLIAKIGEMSTHIASWFLALYMVDVQEQSN